jgi:hypothetical protein
VPEVTTSPVRIAPLPIRRERPARYWSPEQTDFVQFASHEAPPRPIELPVRQFKYPVQEVERPRVGLACPPPFEPFGRGIRGLVSEPSPSPVQREVPRFMDEAQAIEEKKVPTGPPRKSIRFVVPQWKEVLFHCGRPDDMRRKLTRLTSRQRRNM